VARARYGLDGLGWCTFEIIMLPTDVGQREFEDYPGMFRKCGYIVRNLLNFCYTNEGQLNQLAALFVGAPRLNYVGDVRKAAPESGFGRCTGRKSVDSMCLKRKATLYISRSPRGCPGAKWPEGRVST